MTAPDALRSRAISSSRWRAAIAVAGLLAAGCTFATNSQHPGRLQLSTADLPNLGRVLVNGKGRTLYLFIADPPNASTCFGACASIWPPVTTQGRPTVADGAQAGMVTMLARPDGPSQIVYAGHPLYYYQGDTGRGDTYGQGITQFGALWFAVSPQGQIQTTGSAHGGFQL
ncbi:hypothetical protein GCM10010402_17990 [Actinomadura luteofluorescens]|uniref:COG4315 family predicted lipoprotein n=1 Tax=Actinomadura luteofluorescens TaxID=46163 RepID=UPI0021647EE5|nr:hypothetical protein [Actinomadura glauciflava]MCR3740318.1 Secreted repeat of unknown function [Actinomadura glauciflava]